MDDATKAALEWLRELTDAGEREHSERGLNPVDAALENIAGRTVQAPVPPEVLMSTKR